MGFRNGRKQGLARDRTRFTQNHGCDACLIHVGLVCHSDIPGSQGAKGNVSHYLAHGICALKDIIDQTQWICPSPRASWDCISSSCTWEPMEETPHRQCLPVGQHLLKKSLTLLLCACWGLHSIAHVWGLEDKLMELNLGWADLAASAFNPGAISLTLVPF